MGQDTRFWPLRPVWLGGLKPEGWPEVLNRQEIQYGPRQIAPGTSAYLPFESGATGRIWWADGQWMIADESAGQAFRVLEPGVPIHTGHTVWTLIPADWLFAVFDTFVLFGACKNTMSFSQHHCGIPLVGAMTLCHTGQNRRSVPFEIRIDIPSYTYPCVLPIPALEPGARYQIPRVRLQFHAGVLRERVKADKTRLSVRVGDWIVAEKPVTVLGFWDWLFEPDCMKTIAAFVLPYDDGIAQILYEAQRQFHIETQNRSFLRFFAQADNPEPLVIKAIYDNLKENHDIQYVKPDLGRGAGYQTIRPPGTILGRHGGGRIGKGTCVDLALLMAACLEADLVGLCPVVIFTGEKVEEPNHAFVGCWAGRLPGGRPVEIRRDYLVRHIENKSLFVVECNGFTRDAFDEKLTYEEAVEKAVETLKNAAWVCAVDICALRHDVSPMDCPLDPVVGRAYAEARHLAERLHSYVETAYLLYGLLSAGGELTQKLFKKTGWDMYACCRKFEAYYEARFCGEARESIPTGNFTAIQATAKQYADTDCVKTVSEAHLWWALLNRNSPSCKEVANHIGIDFTRFEVLLGKIASRPEPPGSMDLSNNKKEKSDRERFF